MTKTLLTPAAQAHDEAIREYVQRVRAERGLFAAIRAGLWLVG